MTQQEWDEKFKSLYPSGNNTLPSAFEMEGYALNQFGDSVINANSMITPDYNTKSKWGDLGWNTDTLKGAGSILGGVGSLAQAWAGLQNVKLGKEELAAKKDMWSKNYASQATTTNNQINDQNAWKAAQGRTDFASLVPKYKIG